ncbi:MAG: hypothetical protein M2R45_04845 [Verrucomicrobia subdivision 3 bacterium]|nr:hypothetical protein [Limisphaerales bacterium]MCS1416640.1 hypothetical protein [Limisphaerales bacterium]
MTDAPGRASDGVTSRATGALKEWRERTEEALLRTLASPLRPKALDNSQKRGPGRGMVCHLCRILRCGFG